MPIEKKPTEMKVRTDSRTFARMMFFNRVAVERLDSSIILTFGLVDSKHVQRDSYACALDTEAVMRHREEILTFVSNAAPETPTDLEAWVPLPMAHRVDLANIMLVARIGAQGEVRFYNYSMGEALEARNIGKDGIDGVAVALLRCELQLERSMFLHLYSMLDAGKKKG